MRAMFRAAAVPCVLLVFIAAVQGQAPVTPVATVSVVSWLDRYADGRFDEVVRELTTLRTFDDVLQQLERDGPSWIAAQGPQAAARRELVAVVFALEAARVGSRVEWKFIQKGPLMVPPKIPDGGTLQSKTTPYQAPDTLYWKAPPRILEWACARWRTRPTGDPIERWWQLAAAAVGHYSEDYQFQVGNPVVARQVNVQDEILHLEHASARWPAESRLQLAKAIAVEWSWPGVAVPAFEALIKDPNVSAEAMVRLGVSQGRRQQHADAVTTLRRVEDATRDPHLVYLARLFRGRSLEALKRPEEAERAYRAATLTIPGAQSAATALAALLAAEGRRTDAQQVIAGMHAVQPQPIDPWRVYVHGDDRYWAYLRDRLRSEIGQ
jgi:hypothetical protein